MHAAHVEENLGDPSREAGRSPRGEDREAGAPGGSAGILGGEEERLELCEDDRRRFERLFSRLDTNRDGTVDLKELTRALWGARDASRRAKKILRRADSDINQVLDFEEFTRYMLCHENKLRKVFTSLDANNDGKIEPKEVKSALKKMGVHVTIVEAYNLTYRLDKNKDDGIDWVEWRDYFDMCPEDTLEDIIDVWRSPPLIDIGEQLTCPPEFQNGVSWRYLVAGGVAGAVSRTLTAPFDRLKVMCQVYGAQAAPTMVRGMQRMVQEGGWRSLWRGNGTSGMKLAPESAIRFYAYEQLKRYLSDETDRISLSERFAVGCASGAIAQTCVYPMEVIKTRLAVGAQGQYTGFPDCARKILRQEGLLPFYRGYLLNLVSILPYAGIDLTIYETMKQMYLQKHPEQKDPGITVLFMCSTVSSTCGQLASYPFALVRTRLQAKATPDAQNGALPLVRTILEKEGPRGLFRGMLPNFIKVLPAASVSYVIYERLKAALGADDVED